MDLARPLSWSAISSFEWDKEQWYAKYVLKQEQPPSREMLFGKKFADSVEAGKPLAPVTVYSIVEQKLECQFAGISLLGFMDTYEPKFKVREYKSGKNAWTQEKVDNHGQITMYLLMLYIIHGTRPEQIKCHLDWIPTYETGDFQIDFVRPIRIHTFTTKRTMRDILVFGQRIKRTYKEMQAFAENHE